MINPPEQCNDFNLEEGDGCSSIFISECGNGKIDRGE